MARKILATYKMHYSLPGKRGQHFSGNEQDPEAKIVDIKRKKMTSSRAEHNDDPASSEIAPLAQNKRAKRIPLARLLVERTLFENADEAQRWIMAGKVLVDDHLLDKPGMLVARTARLRVRGRSRYVGRGGYKLEAALAHFAIDMAGQIALDCGASTGGFSDCLLQHGAALVYAVDAGHDQLAGRLRVSPQVRNLENTNLSDLLSMHLDPTPTLITLDLSYLSLTKALPVATALLAPRGRVLALVKPLFEVESSGARRSGQIDDPGQLVEALQRVIASGRACGLTIEGAAKLALQPRHGVHEFFVAFSRDAAVQPWQYSEQTLYELVEGPGVGRVEEESF